MLFFEYFNGRDSIAVKNRLYTQIRHNKQAHKKRHINYYNLKMDFPSLGAFI